MKGHPSSRGWTTLQTFRLAGLTKTVCARYSEGHVVLGFWKYDSAKQERGEPVEWEMTQEIALQHHAIATLHTVFVDGMRAHLAKLIGGPRDDT